MTFTFGFGKEEADRESDASAASAGEGDTAGPSAEGKATAAHAIGAAPATFDETSDFADGLRRGLRPASFGGLASTVRTTDIEQGVYEGGFKVWEGSLDLVAVLQAGAVPLAGRRVVEYGCGHGLPALYALARGDAAEVVFHDYNEEVLVNATMPNVLLNVDRAAAEARARFFSGDWATFQRDGGDTRPFDVVLAAEVLYSELAVQKFTDVLLRTWSTAPDAVAVLANKTYYFGVGGGTTAFAEELRRRRVKDVHVQQLRHYEDGSSNVREVLLLTRRPPATSA